jgi:hypothetical protein
MRRRPDGPSGAFALGLGLTGLGGLLDLLAHLGGRLVDEPLAHGLTLAGMGLTMAGTGLAGWRLARAREPCGPGPARADCRFPVAGPRSDRAP